MSRRPPPRKRKAGRSGRGSDGRARHGRSLPSEILEIEVDALGAQGDGLAAWSGRMLYIPGALPGEKVRVKTGHKRGDGVACTLLDVLDPAPGRAQPVCGLYARCGGCALQHLDADSYAAWKRARVADALAKRGFAGVPVLDPVLIGPGTRRRVTFTACKRGKALTLGFNARASHDVVAVDECPLLVAELNALLAPLAELLAAVTADGARLRILATAGEGGADILIQSDQASDDNLTLAAREAIAAFAVRGHAARVAWQGGDGLPEQVAQVRAPVVRLGGVAVELPMGAFLQASAEGEAALVAQALAGVGDAQRIADLYCGLGTFTLALASRAVVRAVDSHEPPVRALERAAGQADLGGRVLAEVRDLDNQPLDAKELDKFDAVLFDPPRAGAAAQAAEIANSHVPRVVAVSCNPATFARDARTLVDGGYALVDVLPVDQFTFSPHVELVARFEKKQD